MSANQLRAVTTGATSTPTIFTYLQGNPKFEKSIAAVAGQFFTADRFLRLAINAVKKTPLLLQCDPQSVLGAFMTSAALGLEPNTVQQQAFLIPYKKRAKINGEWVDVYDCQFQIGYRGFITLAHRSDRIASIEAETIHEHDHFKHMKGSNSFLEYEKALKDRGDPIGAYCFTKLTSGMEMATVLPLEEIHKIRSRSETYNALVRKVEQADKERDRISAEQKLADTPWVLWFDDMAAKSAIKKHAKQLPLAVGDAMNTAAAIDSDAEANVIDMAAMADPDVVRGVVQDGYEPPALENDPSESADFTPRQREAEPIEVRTGAAKHSPRKAQAEAGKPAQAAESSAPADEGEAYMDHQAILASIQNAKDHDALGLAADSIQDCAPAQQEALTAAYHKRLDELDSAPTQASRRRPSNISME